MPVYEFYCGDCHVVFNFLARRVNTEKRPDCPRCGRQELERQISLFAISKGRKESDGGDDEFPDLDEAKLEQAMGALASEAEGMDEEDPRQVARMMRKLYDATGMDLGDGMAEAIRRMEAGEDPDTIEEEMGDLLEGEDPFSGGSSRKLKGLRRRLLPPQVDDTLHEL
ncbi:MAG: zinc ribbon domain-containing protein [Deferrisomatales bacterium]|nr:zinc ribbon domain-containing protein [Deferrisomatales bacterium]